MLQFPCLILRAILYYTLGDSALVCILAFRHRSQNKNKREVDAFEGVLMDFERDKLKI